MVEVCILPPGCFAQTGLSVRPSISFNKELVRYRAGQDLKKIPYTIPNFCGVVLMICISTSYLASS